MAAAHLLPAQLDAHLSDALGPDEARAAEAHLSSCVECRRMLEAARAAREATAPHRDSVLTTLQVPTILQLAGNPSVNVSAATDPALMPGQLRFNPTPQEGQAASARGRSFSDPRRGDPIGRYVVVGMVGQGGMANVFAAYDPQLDRKVALKLLRHDDLGRPDELLRARMLREAQAMARLTHPNVVAVYDAGSLGEQIYLAMEFVPGPTLAAWTAQQKRPWREVLQMYLGAGRGLAAAHAAGLVHRDFKPENVLVAPDGRPKVTDFGLAHLDGLAPAELETSGSNTSSSPKLTNPGAFIGTPAYMAPEQFGGRPVDARSDQFSFCVALYEALYGVRPYPGEDVATIGASLSKGEIAPLDGAEVPGWVRQVLLRGLAIQPSERFPSMEQLIEALDRNPARRRRRLLERAGLAAVACAAVLVAGAMVHRDRTRCAREAERLGGWGPSQAEQLRTRLGAANGGEAVAAELDGYMAHWRDLRIETCQAQAAGSLAPESAELRLRCLDEEAMRASAAAELVGTTEGIKPERFHERLAGLWSPVSCTRLESPRHHWLQDRQRFSARLARLDALNEAGDAEHARAEAEQLRAEAKAAGAKAVESAATLDLARSYISRGDKMDVAVQLAREAAALAEAAGDDQLAASARVLAVETLGIYLSRTAETEQEAPEARAAVERAGNPPVEASELDRTLGDVAVNKGDPRGVALLQRALDELREAYGPRTPLAIPYLVDIGRAKAVAHDVQGGAQGFLDAVALSTELGGWDREENAVLYSNAAAALVLADKLDEARSAVDRGAPLAEKYQAAWPLDAANFMLNRALVEVEQHQPEPAWADLAHAQKLLEKLDLTSDVVEQLHALRARIELQRGQLEAARADAEQAFAAAGQPPCGPDELADARLVLASVLARSDPGRARGVAQQALAHFKSAPVPLFARRARETQALLDGLR